MALTDMEEIKTMMKPPGSYTPRIISLIADEVTRTVLQRLPSLIPHRRRSKPAKKTKKIEHAIFLDTSAIIDGRIFDVIRLRLLNGVVVILDSILLELKHIADSQDMVKRERGRKGLVYLEKMKKDRDMHVMVIPDEISKRAQKEQEVDEKLIYNAKIHKGKIITCDYNLEKKANIEGVHAINVNALANSLKVMAVPGEALHISVQHRGKDDTQGVGYLDDGTMIVVENGKEDIGEMIDVVVARVIQTATGRILFAKKI